MNLSHPDAGVLNVFFPILSIYKLTAKVALF